MDKTAPVVAFVARRIAVEARIRQKPTAHRSCAFHEAKHDIGPADGTELPEVKIPPSRGARRSLRTGADLPSCRQKCERGRGPLRGAKFSGLVAWKPKDRLL